jgi:hypothetical protein
LRDEIGIRSGQVAQCRCAKTIPIVKPEQAGIGVAQQRCLFENGGEGWRSIAG